MPDMTRERVVEAAAGEFWADIDTKLDANIAAERSKGKS